MNSITKYTIAQKNWIRARLLERGLTVAAFSRSFGFRLSTTRAAIAGGRNGPKAKEIRAKAEEVINAD